MLTADLLSVTISNNKNQKTEYFKYAENIIVS